MRLIAFDFVLMPLRKAGIHVVLIQLKPAVLFLEVYLVSHPVGDGEVESKIMELI